MAGAAEPERTWNDVRLELEEGFGTGNGNATGIKYKNVTFTWSKSAISYRIGGGPLTPMCTKVSMVLEEISRLEARMRGSPEHPGPRAEGDELSVPIHVRNDREKVLRRVLHRLG